MAVTLLPSSRASVSRWRGKQPPWPALYCGAEVQEGKGGEDNSRGKGAGRVKEACVLQARVQGG
jgi:hypothetical protein